MASLKFNSKEVPQEKAVSGSNGPGNITITVVYDNYAFDKNLKTAFGFSCLVQSPDMDILFDTGSESKTLIDNMEKLGINPGDIEIVVLSHNHWDHVGGLPGFLEINPNVTVYMPASFPEGFKQGVLKAGAKYVDNAGSSVITAYARTTGEIAGPPNEQGLLISSSKGLIVITGCAHPGIVNVVNTAKELTGENIHLVLGGFHMGSKSTSAIEEIIESFEKLGVEKVAPSHCTGDAAREMFKISYKENYVESGLGKVFKI